ncbi:RagB/SusD family nutrient uptake outer membrane protein [Gillisia sp. M10.2A]|uniref:RagB/SusD family nutrient uptake outer membrane protein n=1 Tax=Gillisia lutea TaxID=2909668 RepID=A0ABS9ED34_9FLAO|nr:RagB/SusD family nutrient uptake outer membrane protein [Gillisia lutea]MCF4100778.1 RagB/SusD family nutrient uptake outer membrane protein [Gillisia lutea]
MNKKLRNILLGLSIAVTASSCEKEWLDVTANTQIEASEQFNSEDGFKDALMGVYIGMTAPELYSKDLTWNIVDLLSQQYETLPIASQYDQIQQFKYDATSSIDKLDGIWKKSYNVLANINLALAYIDKDDSVLQDIDHSLIKGELLALRAFVHFDLLRLYGIGDLGNRNVSGEYAIPYVTQYGKEVTPQLDYIETFALLENDIETAMELLKEDPVYPNSSRDENYFTEANRNGFYNHREQRLNYYAVKALQARVLQWQGGEKLQAAAMVAEEVINESFTSLIASENYPVSSDPIFYPEILFGLNVEGFANIVNPQLNAESSTNYDALYYTQERATDVFETDSVNIGLADVRFNTLLQSQSRGLINIKLLQSTDSRNIMPLIKLPEMYYIAAEYHLEKGNVGTAVNYINTVRSSRGIIQQIPENSEVEQVREELMKEYRKEFLMEGQLFFFYKRKGLSNIPGLSDDTVVDDDIYVLPYPDNEVEFGNR